MCHCKRQLVLVAGIVCGAALKSEGNMVIASNATSTAPIVVATNASEETRIAVETLAEMIEKTAGARPDVVVPETAPAGGALWIGPSPPVATRFPNIDFAFAHPEEILIACNGTDLVIAGRDRFVGDSQVEFGTANAIYTFLQKHLDVRAFRPWDREGVWLDVIERDPLVLPAFTYRFHPPFRQRLFWPGRPADWDRFQRLRLWSYEFYGGHGFTDWWDTYHAEHPEWFALRGNGTRTPESWGGKPNPKAVKLCVSNPQVWTQWLDNAEQTFRDDPTRLSVSASPNDGGSFCLCERCRAWDHPDGPVAGADRYARFWNILARGLRERLPGREAWVGAYAYSSYKNPPLAQALEPNIAIGYVGHFPLANDTVTEHDKAAWNGWAEKATAMVYRPNLFHYSGGFLGLPTVALRRTIRDFRFLAENKCIGLQVDTLPHSFQTQGVQYYLMAQLAYDPYQDGEALLDDYYRRAFGPAANDIAAYFDLMEQAHEQILNAPGFRHSSGAWRELIDTCRRVYTDELLAEAEAILQRAVAKASEGPAKYAPRVEVLRKGLAFTRLQVEIMHVMARVRESTGAEREAAIERATELCARRDAMVKAGHGHFSEWYHNRVKEYMGPPTEELIQATQYPDMQFLPAQWSLAWSDDFERAELGDHWKVVDGEWSVEGGQLVTRGGSLVTTRTFPGLHRLEFTASATPNPGISDMSPMIHCAPDSHSGGYLLQFGGYSNTRNSILRKGRLLAKNGAPAIEPGRTYTIVAEFDGSSVRLSVDGETVIEHADPKPLVGAAHGHVGFYVHEGVISIDNVNVFTSPAVTQD